MKRMPWMVACSMKATYTFFALLFFVFTHHLYATQINNTHFVVVGDMPYMAKEDRMLTLPDGKLVLAIHELNAPVLIHYGDFKGGGESCSGSLLTKRKEQMFSLNPHRVIYTPGDNEWTDCDRKDLEETFSEIESLKRLRALFYKDKKLDLSRDIPHLVRQKEQIENSMWKVGNLLMGTLHIVGTHNARTNILLSDVNTTLDAVDRRDALNLIWLKTLFEHAKDASGLVILFHADIYRFKGDAPACTKINRLKCNPYKNIRDGIEALALVYKKPVLVIHGDTNAYCFNQQSTEISNLWHFNGPGDFKVSDAAQIVFHETNTSFPFEVRGVLNKQIPPAVCSYKH